MPKAKSQLSGGDVPKTKIQPYSVFSNWIWEIISIIVAVGLIVAIAVLLAVHNNKEPPNWGGRVNLNALLAFLSTILRAMLVAVVSQIISQRKWEWFKTVHLQERPLSDIQKFDSGSRGIPGAMMLLPTVWRDPITFMAAMIVLSSFLVGPFVQQASSTSECVLAAPNLEASLPSAHFVPRQGGYVAETERDDLGTPGPDLITAVLSAVTAPWGLENRLRGSCSTGNCTFPVMDNSNHYSPGIYDQGSHSTVAMCSKCVDLTPLVIREFETCGDGALRLPNNMSLSRICNGRRVTSVQPSFDLSWMGNLFTPELKSLSRWAYVNVTFMGLNNYANETAAAVMCSLYPCIQTVSASIIENEVSETIVGSKPMQLDMQWNDQVMTGHQNNALNNMYKSYTAIESPCRAQGMVYDFEKNPADPANGTYLMLQDHVDYGPGSAPSTIKNITVPNQCIYRQHPLFAMALARSLNYDIFDGSCTLAKLFKCRGLGTSSEETKFLQRLGSETVLRALYRNHTGERITTGFSNVTEWFDRFAEVMTRKFRADYGTAEIEKNRIYNNDNLQPDRIYGIAWQTTTCVSMRGVWLALPITLTVVTAILSIFTIVTNWRYRHSGPVWKDSILPLIFYSRDIVNGALDRYNHDEMEKTLQDEGATKDSHNPLEAKDMEKIGNSTAVNIPWLHSTDHGEIGITRTNRLKWGRHKEKQKDASDEQLLDGDNLETSSVSNVPRKTEARVDNQTPNIAQEIEEDGPLERLLREEPRQEAEPNQEPSLHGQGRLSGNVGTDDVANSHRREDDEHHLQACRPN